MERKLEILVKEALRKQDGESEFEDDFEIFEEKEIRSRSKSRRGSKY